MHLSGEYSGAGISKSNFLTLASEKDSTFEERGQESSDRKRQPKSYPWVDYV